MRLRTVIELAAALLLTFAALAAISQMVRAGSLRIEGAYARATIGMAKTGAVYLTVTNDGSSPDRLRRATLRGRACAASCSCDEGRCDDDGPGGMPGYPCRRQNHDGARRAPYLLTGLASPLKEGQQFPMRLSFDNAGETVIDVVVKGPGAGNPNLAGHIQLEFCD